jgi:hypothetical protein
MNVRGALLDSLVDETLYEPDDGRVAGKVFEAIDLVIIRRCEIRCAGGTPRCQRRKAGIQRRNDRAARRDFLHDAKIRGKGQCLDGSAIRDVPGGDRQFTVFYREG